MRAFIAFSFAAAMTIGLVPLAHAGRLATPPVPSGNMPSNGLYCVATYVGSSVGPFSVLISILMEDGRVEQKSFTVRGVNGARSLNVNDYGIREGSPANLVVLDAASPFDALRYQAIPLYVISRGKIIARNQPSALAFTG